MVPSGPFLFFNHGGAETLSLEYGLESWDA
jgi:hypothetical protein